MLVSRLFATSGSITFNSKLPDPAMVIAADVTAQQEGLGQCALTADLDESNSLNQSPSGTSGLISTHNRSGFEPEMEIARFPHAVDQVLPHALRAVAPALDRS